LFGGRSARCAPSAWRGIQCRDRPFIEPALKRGNIKEDTAGELDVREAVVLHPSMKCLVGDLQVFLDLFLR
jgi:hypothetical protein